MILISVWRIRDLPRIKHELAYSAFFSKMLQIYRFQWHQGEQISGEPGSPKMCSPWAVEVLRRVTPKGVTRRNTSSKEQGEQIWMGQSTSR